MYKLSKLDIAALKKADYIAVVLVAGVSNLGVSTVRATKRIKKNVKNPFAQDVDHEIDAPVRAHKLPPDGARWVESVNLYPDNHASSILATLKAGDEIEFEFYPDMHSTENMRNANLHGDALLLLVQRGKKRFCFELSSSVCPENSARMCKGANREKRILVSLNHRKRRSQWNPTKGLG